MLSVKATAQKHR